MIGPLRKPAFPLIKLAKKLKVFKNSNLTRIWAGVFPLIKLAKKLKEYLPCSPHSISFPLIKLAKKLKVGVHPMVRRTTGVSIN